MIDERALLERAAGRFAPEPGIVDRVIARRRRKQRNQRIGSAVLAVVVLALTATAALQGLRSRETPAHRLPVLRNGLIAFVSPGDGAAEDRIYTMKPNGTGLVQLAGVHAEYPSWSADGTTIAFDSGTTVSIRDWTKSSGHIFTVRADGTGLRQLTSGPGAEFTPAWSPDGKQLAVTAQGEPGAAPGIFLVDAASGEMRAVTSNPYPGYLDKEPDFSPDGRRIVFVRERSLLEAGGKANLAALFVVNVDGTGLRRLTEWQDAVGTPSWSPNGTSIVFRAGCCVAQPDEGGSLMQIFVIESDGSGLRQLTSGDFVASFWPSWSPDGRRIVFSRYDVATGQPQRLYTMASDGSDVRPVPSSIPATNEAAWGTHP